MQLRHETKLAGTSESFHPISLASLCTIIQAASNRLVPHMFSKAVQNAGRVHEGDLTNVPAERQDQNSRSGTPVLRKVS